MRWPMLTVDGYESELLHIRLVILYASGLLYNRCEENYSDF